MAIQKSFNKKTLFIAENKIIKWVIWLVATTFILVNTIAFFHAYKFTHFANANIEKTKDPAQLSIIDKIQALLLGVNNPKPVNEKVPTQFYRTIRIKSNKEIECWNIEQKSSKGTVVLFHGYAGHKSSMLDRSDQFLKLGYNTLLVDFMGSGGSEGNQTTIGFFEAQQVKSCFEYLKQQGEGRIYLYGTSMGAVAILKAIDGFKISPTAIIIECPFGSMYKTVCARFRILNLPTFPMAGLLVFWGGIQNNFWAFGHNPTKYAKSVNCPTLLMYGEQDEKVSLVETEEIFVNLKGKKDLKTYLLAGHENFMIKYKRQWIENVGAFLINL